jgi:hypothetical protein
VYSEDVGDTKLTFDMVFKAEYLRSLFPASYKVEISSKGVSHFISEEVEYWIAIEAATSKFGG